MPLRLELIVVLQREEEGKAVGERVEWVTGRWGGLRSVFSHRAPDVEGSGDDREKMKDEVVKDE